MWYKINGLESFNLLHLIRKKWFDQLYNDFRLFVSD